MWLILYFPNPFSPFKEVSGIVLIVSLTNVPNFVFKLFLLSTIVSGIVPIMPLADIIHVLLF
jgi:hypothetical protein